MKSIHAYVAVLLAGATLAGHAGAAVTAPAGYIYSTQLLGGLTQGCIAAGPGGTFVGIGATFTANAEAIVLARESGELRLVAMGFNSIADCAYDPVVDALYVTDNADNADLGITTSFAGNTGAQTGDTVFRIPNASTAGGLSAKDLELLPANAIEFAAGVTVDGTGAVLVSDAAGGTSGRVLKITAGPSSTTLVPSLAFAGGVALAPSSGDLFVAENLGLPNFDNQVLRYTAAGAPVGPVPFAGPSFDFGSLDLLFNADGRLLASGNFGADVVSFDVGTGSSTPFVSGLTFASGMTIDPFTHRVQILSSTFTGADEDRSLHRFTPIDRLVAGGGSSKSDCAVELYGVEVVGNTATCVDGAACDADGVVNDSCLFPVGLCFNVADPDLADCSDADDVTEVTLTAKPASAAISTVAAAIDAALPISGTTCRFSDGYALPVNQTPAGKKDGKATLKVKSRTADGRTDTDVVRLVCTPAS
ncbi:MAG TPA: hypothetical protein VL049_13250 [Candidatus Dormibacteraeota bacterium]|nr:hypothetical protein [Candidatus Dormibacteraeota bacterium]